MTDCTLCLEWEICPFHKPEPELTKCELAESEVPTVEIKTTQPTTIHGTLAKIRAKLLPTDGIAVSDCGHYIRTYVNGVCVDEEPID